MPEPLFDVERAGGEESPPGGRADIVLRLRVQPAAGRPTVVGRSGDALHVRVAAPPVGGRANAAAAELVAELLAVKRDQVELAGGERSRSKRFRVRGVEVAEVGRLLDEAVAQAGAGPLGRRRDGRRARR